MADTLVSDEIRNFILKRIESVAQIEALLLMRSATQSRWSAAELARRLYISDSEATDALDRLSASELLVCAEGSYSLEGVLPQNLALTEKMLEAYTRHLIPVTNIVHSKPGRVGSFADAFKFRKGS